MGVESKTFAGFPPGTLATAIPNLFFTAVLPRISDPAELVVTLYCFFVHGRKKAGGPSRFLTYAELAGDDTLAAALASQGEDALRRGLDAAVERGSLLRLDVERDGQREELYFINTATGRRAVAAIEAGKVSLGRPLPEAREARPALPNIFELYEENIGPLTPMVAEYLEEAEQEYPAAWFQPAFQRAVQQNVRRWSYVAAILKQWKEKGPDYEKAGRDLEGDDKRRQPLSGRYRHLVRR